MPLKNTEKPKGTTKPSNKRATSKSHGRLSVDDYTDIYTVNVEHTEYKAGQEYPGPLWPKIMASLSR